MSFAGWGQLFLQLEYVKGKPMSIKNKTDIMGVVGIDLNDANNILPPKIFDNDGNAVRLIRDNLHGRDVWVDPVTRNPVVSDYDLAFFGSKDLGGLITGDPQLGTLYKNNVGFLNEANTALKRNMVNHGPANLFNEFPHPYKKGETISGLQFLSNELGQGNALR